MSNVTPLVTADKAGQIMEAVLIRGDLADLTPEERAKYQVRVCQSLGLNPLTRPFEFIILNGKLTLYARKDATDQLRMLYKISVTELIETEREGVFIVTAKVATPEGRTDVSKGAVNIAGLKGDALANAMMKAETKSKRRATLSICGLGMLDETELETIPAKPTTARERNKAIAALPDGERQEATERAIDEWSDRQAGNMRNAMRQPAHDADGVVWEESGTRPATAADFDNLEIPAQFDRRPKKPKDDLLAQIATLETASDILTFGLGMSISPQFEALSKDERAAIHLAIQARQRQIMNEHVAPAQHQTSMRLNGGRS